MLLADRDRESFAAARRQGIAQQIAPVRHFEQALQLLPRREFGLSGQQLCAAQVHRGRARRRDRDVEQSVRFLHEDVEQLGRPRLRWGRVAQPVGERRANLFEPQAREALVEDDRHFLHGVGGELRRDFHEDRPHRTATEREHEQQLFGGDLEKIEAIEDRFVDGRRDGHAQLVRQHAEDLRGTRQNRFDSGALPFELAAEVLRLRRRDDGRPHQVVDVDAIREVGRNPAGGGVGMVEVSLFLEVAHRVADRRGRQAELIARGDRPAPRRLGGLHVGLDDGLENGSFSLSERRGHG